MGGHAVNAGLHNSTGIKIQHGKSLFDDVPIAACSEPFILEFLFQSLHFHACNALGPHKGIGHDYAGEFIDCEKALLDVRGGFHVVVADAQPWEMMVLISSSSTPSGSRNSRTW